MNSCRKDIEAILMENLSQEKRMVPARYPRVPAAVLIPFVCVDGVWNLLFTKRANGVATHRGEISFPGGSAEMDDGDLIETALRETHEEIGIDKTKIRILGSIDPVPTVSNFCVLPVIGIIDWPVELRLNEAEVEKTILIPIDWLKHENNWHQEEFVYEEGKSKTVIHYDDYQDDHLWGLTAMLAQQVLKLI